MTIQVAVLGCGMMGQEHISYMETYPNVHIRYLCDPHSPSIQTALSLIQKQQDKPLIFTDETELIAHAHEIDLLVIATPNYLHTPQLLKWGNFEHLCILVEKPVAINKTQLEALAEAKRNNLLRNNNIWVAMEYRYIPAIQKLIQLIPDIVGPDVTNDIKCITIRENRFPFLTKVGEWNKDLNKSGDTLVEKCCHFFDLFRLLSGGQEMNRCSSKVQRGILSDEYFQEDQYDIDEKQEEDYDDPSFVPIIDSAYVLLDFKHPSKNNKSYRSRKSHQQGTMGCLELCMFADGSRHQEEIIVTGRYGRLEAYLPENKVYAYRRAKNTQWTDRSKPPPKASIESFVIDCSDLNVVYPSFANEIPSSHVGYHYASTAIEWKLLLDQVIHFKLGGTFKPQVSLEDGMNAVAMGIEAQRNITNSLVEDSVETTSETRDLAGPSIMSHYPVEMELKITTSSSNLIDNAFRNVSLQELIAMEKHAVVDPVNIHFKQDLSESKEGEEKEFNA